MKARHHSRIPGPVSTEVISRVEHVLRRCGLWGKGVLAAVSGGLDSTCLLRILVRLRDNGLGPVEAAHVDHGVRPGSEEDAAFCRDLAGALGVPFHTRRLSPPERAGEGFQAWARAQRRAFLAAVCRRRGLSAVALGHHADDQVETVLFRLLRGAGPRGLSGMAEFAPPFVRPLLGVPRAALERLAREEGWTWREDPSNRGLRYARNRIRREVLPLLREVHPGAEQAVLRAARLVAEDDEVLSRWAAARLEAVAAREPDGLRLPVAALAAEPPAVRRRMYLAALARVGGTPWLLEFHHLEAVDRLLGPGRAHRRAPLPGRVGVIRSYEHVWFVPGLDDPVPEVEVALPEPGRVGLPGGQKTLVWGRVPAGVPAAAVPPGRGRGGIWARTRRPGDRIRGPDGSFRKIKDLLMEAKVPAWRRRSALVLGDREGGFGMLAPERGWWPPDRAGREGVWIEE